MPPARPISRALLGSSRAMGRVRAFVRTAGETGVSVLLEGETGTGKSLVARLIHEAGEGAAGPLVSVNCAGIPETLFESELFGHERGAFTGAHSARRGLVEEAEGGTLFLDEIGELSIPLQAKLLTVLEGGRVRRVGSSVDRPVRFRLISASVRDLLEGARHGSFRRDLLYRLAVLRCRLPALRERPEDVERIARTFLRRLGRRHGRGELRLSREARDFLTAHDWPGNVRELRHALEAAVILGSGPRVTVADLRSALLVHDTRLSSSGLDTRAS